MQQPEPLECACVIYGKKYDWGYVEKLHSMLSRNVSSAITLNVLTEPSREVPREYRKIPLDLWPEDAISGDLAWWYKLQLFSKFGIAQKPVAYFDLDVVIIDNIDWIWQQDLQYFWSIRDFRYLHNPRYQGMNSSVMIWQPSRYHWIWDDFAQNDLRKIVRIYRGDQEYIYQQIPRDYVRFFDPESVRS